MNGAGLQRILKRRDQTKTTAVLKCLVMQWDTPWKCQTQTSCGCHAAGGLRKPCAWEHKKVTATHSEILINTVNKLCCGAQRPGLIFLKSIKKYKKKSWFVISEWLFSEMKRAACFPPCFEILNTFQKPHAELFCFNGEAAHLSKTDAGQNFLCSSRSAYCRCGMSCEHLEKCNKTSLCENLIGPHAFVRALQQVKTFSNVW